jgi:hypothetical protein
VKTLQEILQECPPRSADEITGEERFYFLLEDGRLIGRLGFNHQKLLGIEGLDPATSKNTFCRQHKALRITFGAGWNFTVEIIGIKPNDAQWAAIGTLYKKKDELEMFWDVLSENGKWSNGHGSLGDFKRLICPTTPLTTAVKRRARPKRKNAQGGSKR